jgi:hypothetical protein
MFVSLPPQQQLPTSPDAAPPAGAASTCTAPIPSAPLLRCCGGCGGAFDAPAKQFADILHANWLQISPIVVVEHSSAKAAASHHVLVLNALVSFRNITRCLEPMAATIALAASHWHVRVRGGAGGNCRSFDEDMLLDQTSEQVPDKALYARIQQLVRSSPAKFWEPVAEHKLHWFHVHLCVWLTRNRSSDAQWAGWHGDTGTQVQVKDNWSPWQSWCEDSKSLSSAGFTAARRMLHSTSSTVTFCKHREMSQLSSPIPAMKHRNAWACAIWHWSLGLLPFA